jgi:hypothetical protein
LNVVFFIAVIVGWGRPTITTNVFGLGEGGV